MKSTPKNYVNLTTNEELQILLKHVRQHEIIAFDLETDSANEKKARVIGLGVSGEIGTGYYAAFWKWNNATQQLERLISAEEEEKFVWDLSRILIGKKLVTHNGVYDFTVMEDYYGIDLSSALYADTILMKHTVDEERPFGLKDIAVRLASKIGFSEEEIANQEQMDLKESIVRNGGKTTKAQLDIYKGDVELIGLYCCMDVDLTLRLFHHFDKILKKEGSDAFFYKKEVMPLYKEVTIPMKMQGIKIDVEYFEKLEAELKSDIIRLSGEVFDLIREDIQPFVRETLDAKVNLTKTGKFAEELLRHSGLEVPVNAKTGKPTLAKGALKALSDANPDHPALKWLLYTQPFEIVEEMQQVVQSDGSIAIQMVEVKKEIEDPNPPELDEETLYQVKKKIFVEKNPDNPEIFNLASNAHLRWLFFDKYNCKPKGVSRQTGLAKVDKDALHDYDHLPFVPKLAELKKVEKLLATYVQPILEMHVNGWLYPAMLQFGTTSGRYSCAGGLNLQTLPRDDSRIKKGFVAPEGYKIVNADFSALEPRIFSWVSNDGGLKAVWHANLDLYSQIAIDVFGLSDVSADENDENYLKKKNPEYRQKTKIFTLAVPYGASAWRIAELMKVEPDEAKDIVRRYLDSYPELKTYMEVQEDNAKRFGLVKTKFGRIRHLPECKELWDTYHALLKNKKNMTEQLGQEMGTEVYYKFRNLLNNAKNFPIQATAAHVCNAAMIKLSREFKNNDINGWIGLTIHDEITCIVKEEQAELAASLLKDAMENNDITNQIDIPIKAEPLIGNNFSETK